MFPTDEIVVMRDLTPQFLQVRGELDRAGYNPVYIVLAIDENEEVLGYFAAQEQPESFCLYRIGDKPIETFSVDSMDDESLRHLGRCLESKGVVAMVEVYLDNKGGVTIN